jgi:hypothetical protein
MRYGDTSSRLKEGDGQHSECRVLHLSWNTYRLRELHNKLVVSLVELPKVAHIGQKDVQFQEVVDVASSSFKYC